MANNNALPSEILKDIFSYVENPKDLSLNCQLVCKSWNQTADVDRKGISVQLQETEFDIFFADLKRFPTFGPKVRCITVIPFGSVEKDLIQFRKMINLCTQLSELHFKTSESYEYMKGLDSHEAKLPFIEKISVQKLECCSLSFKRFHLWMNFKFRETITHLEVFDLKHIDALSKQDPLVNFVTNFPQIKSLHAYFQNNNTDRIDLGHLLEKNKKIQELKLNRVSQIIVDNHQNEDNTFPLVKELDIYAISTTNTDLFQFIMKKFENLNSLRLVIKLPVDHNRLSAAENNVILNKFTNYCNSLEKANILFTCNSRQVRVLNGQVYDGTHLTEDDLLEEERLWQQENLFHFDDDAFDHDEFPASIPDEQDYQDMMLNDQPDEQDFNDIWYQESPDEEDYRDSLYPDSPDEQDYQDMMFNDSPDEQDYYDAMASQNIFGSDEDDLEGMRAHTLTEEEFNEMVINDPFYGMDEPDEEELHEMMNTLGDEIDEQEMNEIMINELSEQEIAEICLEEEMMGNGPYEPDEQDYIDAMYYDAMYGDYEPDEQDYMEMLLNTTPEPDEEDVMDMMMMDGPDEEDMMNNDDDEDNFFDNPIHHFPRQSEELDGTWHRFFDQDTIHYQTFFQNA
ncbi:hypothetical protein BD770DRAFT_381225 [Pilaira anomala]|nr:hypothetical protein BD770DRAFT_381225 [Pilaira anomala]